MQQRNEKVMNANEQWKQSTSDPLGLSQLETIDPEFDGWDEIRSALEVKQDRKRQWRKGGAWLAIAASLVLLVNISLRQMENPGLPTSPAENFATQTTPAASDEVNNNVSALIGLSQNMEEQVKQLRQKTGVMPAESAIYVAELEDLIAQVDYELSIEPESVDLWGQRVNLMLDLAWIYQQQWQVEYGRMASL